MMRAVAKGALLSLFGRIPGGSGFYRTLTRDWLGTQATHVDKLTRVWPRYATVWQNDAGVNLDDSDIWVHEGGWTPFPFFANYLLSGKAGVVTNREGRVLDRYLVRAVDGALATPLPSPSDDRRRRVHALRWSPDPKAAIDELGGILHEHVAVDALPLAASSIDVSHSGGTLEHYRQADLEAFLAEAFRVLRPGGIASHVFDHRDHLHHADPTWPYLAHLSLPDRLYETLYGHPLLYHNRLLPRNVEDLFQRVGFERIVVHRLVLPDRRYVEDAASGAPGIERRHLARRFRSATDEDLRTAAAHYVYRKPS